MCELRQNVFLWAVVGLKEPNSLVGLRLKR